MQFIDLKTQYQKIQADIQQKINHVLEQGQYILGPEVAELEEKLAAFVGVKHCIGVSNGTDALLMALMAIDVKPGDEIITTPFSFIAIAEMIAFLGATPVFVDINPKTYNLEPHLLQNAITANTKAIVPVNLYGQCADYDAINAIAHKHHIPVIEDAAQSLGATYKGRQSGSLATMACTSFYPSKPLGCYGDGGACFTNDDNLAKTLREIRDHGQNGRYQHSRIGINGRLDSLQAAILLVKLPIFHQEIEARQGIGANYSEMLAGNNIQTPFIEEHNMSVYAQYTIAVDDREQLRKKLMIFFVLWICL